MHELPVTEGILQVAIEAAREAGAGRITGIDLVVGELSSIVDDSVQFYFDILSKGTAAEGAELHFRREPARVDCLDCGFVGEIAPPLQPWCPSCGGTRLRVTGSQELLVESIEVEDEDTGGERDTERERSGSL